MVPSAPGVDGDSRNSRTAVPGCLCGCTLGGTAIAAKFEALFDQSAALEERRGREGYARAGEDS